MVLVVAKVAVLHGSQKSTNKRSAIDAAFDGVDGFEELFGKHRARLSEDFQERAENWQVAARDLLCGCLNGTVSQKRIDTKANVLMTHMRRIANAANRSRHYKIEHGGLLALSRQATIGILCSTGQENLENEEGVRLIDALNSNQFRHRAFVSQADIPVIASRGLQQVSGCFDGIHVYRM